MDPSQQVLQADFITQRGAGGAFRDDVLGQRQAAVSQVDHYSNYQVDPMAASLSNYQNETSHYHIGNNPNGMDLNAEIYNFEPRKQAKNRQRLGNQEYD